MVGKDTIVHNFLLLPVINGTCYVLRANCAVQDGIASATGIVCYGRNSDFYVESIGHNILIVYQDYLSNLVSHRIICSANLLLLHIFLAKEEATAVCSNPF